MFQLEEMKEGVFSVRVSGKLTHQNYQQHLIPALEKAIQQYGQISLLVIAEDFHGWEWQAAWDDIKTGLKHRHHFNRIAIVGEKSWQQNLCKFFGLFMYGEVQYFDLQQLSEAERWVKAEK